MDGGRGERNVIAGENLRGVEPFRYRACGLGNHAQDVDLPPMYCTGTVASGLCATNYCNGAAAGRWIRWIRKSGAVIGHLAADGWGPTVAASVSQPL